MVLAVSPPFRAFGGFEKVGLKTSVLEGAPCHGIGLPTIQKQRRWI